MLLKVTTISRLTKQWLYLKVKALQVADIKLCHGWKRVVCSLRCIALDIFNTWE